MNRHLRGSCCKALGAAALVLAALVIPPNAARAAGGPAHVGRVAGQSSALLATSASLAANRTVASGDALLVAVVLRTTTPGTIGVSDRGGNTYTLVLDQSDALSLDRLLVFAATNVHALPAGGSIEVTFPASTGFQVSVDEFSGLAALDRTSSGWGVTTAFSSGQTSVTGQPIELLYGVVGDEAGAAPSWASGWTALPVLSLNTDQLGAAYQVTSSPGRFAASGSVGGVWMAGIASFTAAPPSDDPPAASLSVSPAASPALTIIADGSGSTDADATPIASYRFDFGDGTPAVTTPASTPTARHTYAAAGTYTVALIVTDTAGNRSAAASANITVSSAPSDNPPTARLTVAQEASPALTVKADGSRSTDTDATPIASYQFDFGDGSAPVTSAAPTATARHTYASAGTYTVRLIATDTAGNRSAPVSANITVNSAPSDNPPTASLSVSQASSPALTVTADASGSSDNDATPISSYWFDFGDGTAAVVTSPPATSARHTYAAAGSYTVTLIVTDTAGNRSSPATATITVKSAPPADSPPTARLTVSQAASPPLTADADGSRSTDGDATPIATYEFDFGDGSAPVTTSAPTATARHTYAQAGTYTVTLIATDSGGNRSAPARASLTVNAPPDPGTQARVALYVGYYDNHHASNPRPKPDPWQGSPNVVFVGNPDDGSGGWDTSTIRIDNLGGAPLTGVRVTVDIGSNHYALWGTSTIPAGGRLILAQTSMENFDGSDTNPAGCYGCDPDKCVSMVSHDIPVVHVTMNRATTDYHDSRQVLNTRGVDAGGCPYNGMRNDESHVWEELKASGTTAFGSDTTGTPSGGQASGAADLVRLSAPGPNPSRGDLSIRFGTASRGPIQLDVYDVSGRRVKSCLDAVFEPGDYNLQLRLTEQRPGLYFVRLTTPWGSRNQRFSLLR